MRVSTTFLPRPELARSDRIDTRDTAVVIDVLRATSVMAMAVENDAESIVTTREVTTARKLADGLPTRPLLCGERACKPIEGFDLGNSPADYQASRIKGKTLVLTTTNGTRAIEFASAAGQMITVSFLNLSAGVRYLRDRESVHLVCAGTNGEITAEDVLLAGAISAELKTQVGATFTDDTSWIACELWQSSMASERSQSPKQLAGKPEELAGKLRETLGGRNLIEAGYEADIQHCARIDAVQTVPLRSQVDPATFVGHRVD